MDTAPSPRHFALFIAYGWAPRVGSRDACVALHVAPGEMWRFSKRKWGLKGGGKSPPSKQKWELKVGVYTAKNRPKIGQNVEKLQGAIFNGG